MRADEEHMRLGFGQVATQEPKDVAGRPADASEMQLCLPQHVPCRCAQVEPAGRSPGSRYSPGNWMSSWRWARNCSATLASLAARKPIE